MTHSPEYRRLLIAMHRWTVALANPRATVTTLAKRQRAYTAAKAAWRDTRNA